LSRMRVIASAVLRGRSHQLPDGVAAKDPGGADLSYPSAAEATIQKLVNNAEASCTRMSCRATSAK